MRERLGKDDRNGTPPANGGRRRAGARGDLMRVDVEAGSIDMARDPGLLEDGADFLFRTMEASLWSGWTAWDGEKGGVLTPEGDGPHYVVHDHKKRDWRWPEWEGLQSAFLTNFPEGETGPPFALYLGTIGTVRAEIRFPRHMGVVFGWIEPQVLYFVSFEE